MNVTSALNANYKIMKVSNNNGNRIPINNLCKLYVGKIIRKYDFQYIEFI